MKVLCFGGPAHGHLIEVVMDMMYYQHIRPQETELSAKFDPDVGVPLDVHTYKRECLQTQGMRHYFYVHEGVTMDAVLLYMTAGVAL